MKLLLLSYTCQALVLPPRRLAVGRPLAPRFAPPNKVAIPLEGTYAVANEQKEVPFPHTKLGIGLIVTALVLQSAGASLLARRVALRHSYDGAVAGLLQEAVKVPIGLAWLVFVAGDAPLRQRLGRFARAYTDAPKHIPQLAVPAGCFAAQNVLFYYAHARLSATVYLSLSQSKTLFTALFSVPLLGRRLSKTQWASQPLLMAGCVLVLMQSMASSSASKAGAAAVAAGAAACLASGLLSGFANVFFEKILKKRAQKTDEGFWARQLQLSLVTFLFVLPCAPRNWAAQAMKLPPQVWAVIFLKALGGLLIGATIKYASAISKNFASACAIVLTAALSREARISTTFRSGILAVVASMVMFQACPPKKLSESSVTTSK